MRNFWFWYPGHRYSRLSAWWNGRKDGKRGIPPVDQVEHAPYEMQLKQVGEENIKRVAQDWQHSDQRLKSEYCIAKGAYIARGALLPEAQRGYESALEERENARKALRECPGRTDLGPVAYGLIMVTIGIGEYPLNAIVFRLFGDSELLTYLFSTLLAVGLPLAADFLGKLLKKGAFREGFFSADGILTTLLALIVVMAILGIGYIRERYIEALEVQQLLGIKMDPTMVTLVFVAINLLIFLTATLASYFAHDPAVRRAKKELKAADARLREAQARLAAAQAASEDAARRYQQAKAERAALWEKKRHEAKELRDIVQKLIEIYRTHNLRVRANPLMPKSFTSYPAIKIPTGLEELDWDCPGLPAEGGDTARRLDAEKIERTET